MTALLTGLVSLLVFGVVILVHELGHFWAARHCGIRVEEFSIGFGPKLFAWGRGDTRYTLRLIPLGGYNLFTTPPDPEEDGEEIQPVRPPEKKQGVFPVVVRGLEFEEAGAWQRFFVTLWGAVMNFLLGLVVLLVLVCSMANLGGTTVAQFVDGASSSQTGLQKGDTILAVDGNRVHTANSLAQLFDGTARQHTMTVLRNGEVVIATIQSDELFYPNDTVLKPNAGKQLRPFLQFLKVPDMYRMLLAMHSDDTGTSAYTDALTSKRVIAVLEWFIENSSNSDYIIPYAMGASEPLYLNNSIANRQLNRRLEIYLVPGKTMIDAASSGQLVD